ncbi:MAG: PssE/Cps14G family polysaccharide biosynthesis glycosyltransferase [Clostridium sp.]
MIFITVGSRSFQFDRLIRALDEQVGNGKITMEIFAQIGATNYKPKNFKYAEFLGRDEFKQMQADSDIIITHGGTGVIVNASKMNKKIIGVPRLKKYNEHVDDHQIELLKEFEKAKMILVCENVDELYKVIEKVTQTEFIQYKSNTNNILNSIEEFIENI